MHRNYKIFGCEFYLLIGLDILRSKYHLHLRLKHSAEDVIQTQTFSLEYSCK
jgi:hypothetical protein